MEETARIREEEKLERLEMVKKKKIKFQKGYLSKEESTKLEEGTKTILDLAEMKQNLWRCYREKGKPEPVKLKMKSVTERTEGFHPRGRSDEKTSGYQSITDFFDERKREKRVRVLERRCDPMRTFLDLIENN